MTLEKFLETLTAVQDLENSLSLGPALEAIRSSMTNLVGSPAHPQYQVTLANSLSTYAELCRELGTTLTPALISDLDQIGAHPYFDPKKADEISQVVSANALTPTVARDYVAEYSDERKQFMTTVETTLDGLNELGIKTSKLAPGTTEVAFGIPKELFDSRFDLLIKEFTFIERLLGHISEAILEEAEPVVLQSLASSTPTVLLLAAPVVIAQLGDIVNKFLDAWEKIERIRRARTELSEIGFKKAALSEADELISETVTKVVEETTRTTLARFTGPQARRNELASALNLETRRLYGQIERGLTVHFRSQPDKNASDEEQQALEQVDKVAHKLNFPEVSKHPVLLGAGEILEGNIDSVVTHRSTTTTTKKTTRGKKHDG